MASRKDNRDSEGNARAKMKIAIIGGTGEFGRIFARLFKEEGHEVVITGRDVEKGKRVARKMGVEFSRDNVEAAKNCEVVIVSVPIESTVGVIEEVAPHISPKALLSDFTSVKVEPCNAMVKNASKDVAVIGMHPMFGPRITSLEGQVVILTPVRPKKWEGFLKDFFERQKARVIVTTPEDHDKIMSVVQGLTHFAYVTVASTIKELGVDIKYSKKFASPVYGLMLDFIARIVGQNPQLYASIQMHNPEIMKVHKTFIKQAEILKDVVKDRDMKGFIEIMSEDAKSLGEIEASMGRSDKAIAVLFEELKKLKGSVGKEVGLKHIYSNAVHIGKVKEVDPETVVLLSKNAKEIQLRLSNVELMNEEETRRWKIENLPITQRDFSVLLSEHADEEIIKKMVSVLDTRIVNCDVIDSYKGKHVPKGKKSITFRVGAVDFNAKDFKAIEKVFTGIGGVLR